MELEEMASEIRLLSNDLFKARQAVHRIEAKLGKMQQAYDLAQRESFAFRKASQMVDRMTDDERQKVLNLLLSRQS